MRTSDHSNLVFANCNRLSCGNRSALRMNYSCAQLKGRHAAVSPPVLDVDVSAGQSASRPKEARRRAFVARAFIPGIAPERAGRQDYGAAGMELTGDGRGVDHQLF